MGNLGNKLIQIGQYCDCLQPIINQVDSEPQIQVKDLSEIQIQASKIDHDFQKELELQHRKQKAKIKKRKILSKDQIQNKLIISQKINNEKTQDSLIIDQINFSIQKNQDHIPVKKYCKSKVNRNNKKRKVIFQQDQRTQTYSQNLNDILKSGEESMFVNGQLQNSKNNGKNSYNNKIVQDSFFNQNNQQIQQKKSSQRKKIQHATQNQNKIKFSILDQLNKSQRKKKKEPSQKLIVKKRKPSPNSSQYQQELYQKRRNEKNRQDESLEQVIDLSKLPKTINIPQSKEIQFDENKQKRNQNKREQLQNNSIQLKIQEINKKNESINDSFQLKDYFLDEMDKNQFKFKHQKLQMFN